MHVSLKFAALPLLTLTLLHAGEGKTQQLPPPSKVVAPKPPAPPAIKDFNDARKELNRAAAELDKSIRELPAPPVPPAPPEIDEAALEKSMKEVDAQLAKQKIAVRKGMEEAQAGLERARTDMEKAGLDMAIARKHQEQSLKQAREELEQIRPRIEAQMQEARKGMEQARKDLNAYEDFVDALAAEGRINKSGYTIEHRNGKLIIDGIEQPEAVYNQHRPFLQNKEHMRITKNENGLNIHKDQQPQ